MDRNQPDIEKESCTFWINHFVAGFPIKFPLPNGGECGGGSYQSSKGEIFRKISIILRVPRI